MYKAFKNFYKLFASILILSLISTSSQFIIKTKASAADPTITAKYLSDTYTDSNGSLKYRIYIPPEYYTNPTVSYPIVLFLHGAGERGTNNLSQINNGDFITSQLLTTDRMSKYPCIIIAPQASTNTVWTQGCANWTTWDFASTTINANMSMVIGLLDRITTNLHANRGKIYITGISMGGFGTWDALFRFPNKFAAAIPICGAGDPKMAPTIKNNHIWGWHSSGDPTIPVANSRVMFDALKAANPDAFTNGTIKYTEITGYGHSSWIPAYADTSDTLYKWLFNQTLASPAGDIKGDYIVDLIDITLLSRVVAGWQGLEYRDQSCDVNGDGTVDLIDVTLLSRFVAGWGVIIQ